MSWFLDIQSQALQALEKTRQSIDKALDIEDTSGPGRFCLLAVFFGFTRFKLLRQCRPQLVIQS